MILLMIEAAKKKLLILIKFRLPKQTIPINSKIIPIIIIFFLPQKDYNLPTHMEVAKLAKHSILKTKPISIDFSFICLAIIG